MANSVVQSVREWLNTCPYLGFISGDINVDWLEVNPEMHGIYPTGTATPIWQDMCGNTRYQSNYVIQVSEYAAEDATRLNNSEGMEEFHHWIQSYSRTGFPLPERYDFHSVTAGNGMLEIVDDNGQKGIYRIQINLIYERML